MCLKMCFFMSIQKGIKATLQQNQTLKPHNILLFIEMSLVTLKMLAGMQLSDEVCNYKYPFIKFAGPE